MGVGSLLPLCGAWELNLGPWDWQPAELSHKQANVTLKGAGQIDRKGKGIPGGRAKAAKPWTVISWAEFGEQEGLILCN